MRIPTSIRAPIVCAVLSISFATAATAGSDPTGVWINDTGRGAVEIKPCGNALCGHVVWVKDEADAAKGCGKQIIGDVTPVGGGRWDNGWIYSPEKHRNYDVELTPLKSGKLQVTGYAGMKFLSKTMIWTPAPADLKRCGETAAKATPVAPTVEVAKSTPSVAPAPDKAAAPAAPPVATSETNSPAQSPAPDTFAASEPAASAPAETQTAENDSADSDSPLGKLGGFKLGDIEKVISRTKDGKCKLDLPWLKVQIDCKGN